jgi:hypothetical protein
MTQHLTPDEHAIRELADALVDVLEERGLFARKDQPAGRVLNVADVARLLGRSKP